MPLSVPGEGRARISRAIAGLGLAALASACAVVPPSVAEFRDTTIPVSVGPVERIGAKAGAAAHTPVRTFRTDATNLYRYTSSPGGGGTVYHATESAGVFDIAVEKARDDCSACRVRVKRIFAGSHSAVLIGTSDDTHWTGADLEIYRSDRQPGGRK